MTNINVSKIKENALALGLKPCVIDSTEKRSHVRKLLNGLGFKTEDYIELTMPQLQAVYNALLNGNESDAQNMTMIKSCMIDRAIQAQRDFFEAVMKGASKSESKPVSVPEAVKMDKMDKMTESDAIRALRALIGGQQSAMDYDGVQAMIDKAMENIKAPLPTEIVIKTGDQAVTVPVGVHHHILPNLIKALTTGCNIMLVGPAGSGKTTLAHQAAEALGVSFYFNGAISSEYKLTGFVDAQGRIVSTAFRRAYEQGGLYLFDEIDASMPDALLAFNAALANGHMDFPDGTIQRHEKFYCIAAANTFGKGADRVYVGRNQLDAASLDRFIVLTVDYDEKLERQLAGNDNWCDKVQGIRKAVYEHKIRHVISPRASINGARMLAAGFKESEVMDSVVWKGLDADSVKKIKASI